MININVVNKNIMETVQTSVNIITLYPCWEKKEEKPIQLCDVLAVVCIAYKIYIFEHKKEKTFCSDFFSRRMM